MKAKVFLLLLPCLLFSCTGEVRVIDDRRIQVSGSFDGSESDKIPVVTYGTYNMWPVDNPDKILGFTESNNGEFSFISLDTDSHDLLIAINPETIEGYKENWGSYYYYDDSGKHQLSYNLGEVGLSKRTEFEFNIENTSGTSDTLYYTFEYKEPIKYFVKSPDGFEEVNNDENYVRIYQMPPLSEPRVHHIHLAVNNGLKFIYNFNNEPSQEITVDVNSETNSYDFEY